MAVQPLRDLLDLPPEQRLELAMALWDSLSGEQLEASLPLDPALSAELDRRWELHQQNPEQAIPWGEVQQRLGL